MLQRRAVAGRHNAGANLPQAAGVIPLNDQRV